MNYENLEQAREALDKCVAELMAEKRQQARRLTPVLNSYLTLWARDQEHLSDPSKKRPPPEVAQAKHELADRIGRQLHYLGFAIHFANRPTMLMVQSSQAARGNRYGLFVLMPQGSQKAVITRANLSDLLMAAGEDRGEPGFALVEATIRREPIDTWRARVQAGIDHGSRTV